MLLDSSVYVCRIPAGEYVEAEYVEARKRVVLRWTVGAIVIIGAILTALLSIAEFA